MTEALFETESSIVIRPYQERIIKTLYRAFVTENIALLQLPTGAGKTIIFSELTKRLMHRHGYIYGKKCASNAANFFPKLTYQQKISELIDEGYLAPYRARICEDIKNELKSVAIRSGEYSETELTEVMTKTVHVDTAVKAYLEFGEGRQHCIVFAVTISHANILAARFQERGVKAYSVHSDMPQNQRSYLLDEFHNGNIPVIVSVGILTEGWDEDKVDVIIFCRPTLSSALYVQMIGRGLRIAQGKKDLLILDLSGNCEKHGDPDEPRVTIKKAGEKKKSERPEGKICPECEALLNYGVRRCKCGYVFQNEVIETELRGELKSRDAIWNINDPDWEYTYPMKFESASVLPYMSKKNNLMAKLILYVSYNSATFKVHHFIDVEGNGSLYGKSSAKRFWNKHATNDEPPPRTVAEFCDRVRELTFPRLINVTKENGYLKAKL